MYRGSLSEIWDSGSPSCWNISRNKTSVTSRADSVHFVAGKWTRLEKRSTKVIMASKLRAVLGKCVMKSILMNPIVSWAVPVVGRPLIALLDHPFVAHTHGSHRTFDDRLYISVSNSIDGGEREFWSDLNALKCGCRAQDEKCP